MIDRKDEELIGTLLSREPLHRSEALKGLYRQFFPSTQSFVTSNSGSLEDAEDVFQEAVAVLYDKLRAGTFKGDSKLSTYLFAICKNIWLQTLKKRKRSDNLSVEMKLTEEDSTAFTINTNLIERVFQELKEDCRRLLIAFYYHKLSIRSIQQTFEMNSEQVVKNKKKRCLTYLMNIIQSKNMDLHSFFDE